jgi:hypothetical protein
MRWAGHKNMGNTVLSGKAEERVDLGNRCRRDDNIKMNVKKWDIDWINVADYYPLHIQSA